VILPPKCFERGKPGGEVRTLLSDKLKTDQLAYLRSDGGFRVSIIGYLTKAVLRG
jgi:hypothetical protein